jgi:mono/diheme cytochrome c family protein
MRLTDKAPKYFVMTFLAAGLGLLAWQIFAPSANGQAYTVPVKVPTLSAVAMRGKTAFDANCAACHGVNASGTDKGPPLIHNIYNPGHHGDAAFYFAAKQGVRAHHWRYGDMPPQPQVTESQIKDIVGYVRELQRANGIGTQPHRM